MASPDRAAGTPTRREGYVSVMPSARRIAEPSTRRLFANRGMRTAPPWPAPVTGIAQRTTAANLSGELGVETLPSDMSFAVTEPDGAFEYSSRGLGGFFAQKSNWFFRGPLYVIARDPALQSRSSQDVNRSGCARNDYG